MLYYFYHFLTIVGYELNLCVQTLFFYLNQIICKGLLPM